MIESKDIAKDIDKLVCAFNEMIRGIRMAFETFNKWIKLAYRYLLEDYATQTNSKWKHYYKYAKKHRIRKKYENNIKNSLFESLRKAANNNV